MAELQVFTDKWVSGERSDAGAESWQGRSDFSQVDCSPVRRKASVRFAYNVSLVAKTNRAVPDLFPGKYVSSGSVFD